MAFEFSNTSEGFENAKAWVDLICLRFANVIPTHLTGFDGVQHTLGKTQQQGIEQGCHHSVPSTQDR